MDRPIFCPVCSSEQLILLFRVSSSFVSRNLTTSHDAVREREFKNKIEAIWSDSQASYYRCKSCSFEFAHPFKAADAELYSLMYHSEGVYPETKWEFSETIKHIEEYNKILSRSPALLEIGAGNGSFLKLVLKTGISPEKMIATEFSEAGMKAVSHLGIKCFNRDVKDIDPTDILFKIDIVCLFQVLEHLSDIRGFFTKVNQITHPGAQLFISVPNGIQRRFYEDHGHFYDLPPVHVGRYNELSLGKLAEQFGWKISNSAIQPSIYSERARKFLYAEFEKRQMHWPTEKLKIKLLKLFLRYSIYIILVLLNIRLLTGLRSSNLGTARWFRLERI